MACKVRPPRGQIKKRTHTEMESIETTLLMITFSQTEPDFINLIKLRFCLSEISPCGSLCVTRRGKKCGQQWNSDYHC